MYLAVAHIPQAHFSSSDNSSSFCTVAQCSEGPVCFWDRNVPHSNMWCSSSLHTAAAHAQLLVNLQTQASSSSSSPESNFSLVHSTFAGSFSGPGRLSLHFTGAVGRVKRSQWQSRILLAHPANQSPLLPLATNRKSPCLLLGVDFAPWQSKFSSSFYLLAAVTRVGEREVILG